jgi:hypothetical protein
MTRANEYFELFCLVNMEKMKLKPSPDAGEGRGRENLMSHTTKVKGKYWYGKQTAEVTPADGVKGTIIRTFDGGYAFRVYHDQNTFTDYDIRHDDLNVTIDADALAAFYKVGEHNILDHSPQVLGLKEVE